MKILFVCEGLNNHSIRVQPWKHVFEIARRMKIQSEDVYILTNSDNSLINQIDNVKIIGVRKGKFLFNRNELENVLKNFDIINWNSSGPLSALNFMHIKNLGKEMVWTLHSGIITMTDIQNLKLTDLFLLAGFWNNFLYSIQPATIIKKAIRLGNLKTVIVLSKRLKNYLLKFGIQKEKVQVVYSGVDIRTFTPKSKADIEKIKRKMGFSEDEAIILYYGPLTPLRGVDELIDAIPLVLAKHQSVRFLFLARSMKSDPRSSRLKKRILGHKKATLIEGVQSQESIVEYLNVADVVVLPFRFWPYVECPLTVLETMATGRPLVTTSMGAIPEIVQDGIRGLVIKPRKKDLGCAIIKLLKNDKLASEIAKNARNYVEKYHSWSYVMRQTKEIFDNALIS